MRLNINHKNVSRGFQVLMSVSSDLKSSCLKSEKCFREKVSQNQFLVLTANIVRKKIKSLKFKKRKQNVYAFVIRVLNK